MRGLRRSLPVKDLNDYKETLELADAHDEETIGCCCFAEGPISINVNTAKSGFVPGEKAVINVKVCSVGCRVGHVDVRNCPSDVSFKTSSQGDHWTQVYPSLPGYSGLRYVSYTTK